jgi:hypothetical protein
MLPRVLCLFYQENHSRLPTGSYFFFFFIFKNKTAGIKTDHCVGLAVVVTVAVAPSASACSSPSL